MTTAHVQNLDQKRARHAWEQIARLETEIKSEESKKDLGRAVKRLSPQILTSGLLQTVSFLAAKQKLTPLYLIKMWLHQRWPSQFTRPTSPSMEDHGVWCFLNELNQLTAPQLIRTTEEVLNYTNWLVRYAEAKGWTKAD